MYNSQALATFKSGIIEFNVVNTDFRKRPN
jgi:hypothetical protein